MQNLSVILKCLANSYLDVGYLQVLGYNTMQIAAFDLVFFNLQILFITNHRTIGPYGGTGRVPFSLDGKGKPLRFISGISNLAIESLNFHFLC